MRIFNFRYLLIAGALLTVWLMGRSRSVQPALDTSWTPITGDMVSTGDTGSIAACKQNCACTDGFDSTIDSMAQAMPTPEISQQATILDEPELVEESSSFGEPVFVDESSVLDSSLNDMASELALDMESSQGQVASEVEESISAVTTEAADMVEFQMDSVTINDSESFQPVAQMDRAETELQSGLADVRSLDGSVDQSVSPASRVGNRFMSESEEQPQTEKPSSPWTQNPFLEASVDLSANVEEVVPVPSTPELSTPASFEQSSGSVLDAEPTTQASYPEPDLSQMNYVRNDIAPVNGTLPEGVAQEAVHHIEYGKSLSRRGASFGARQKFFAALGVIARGNDVQTGGNAYTTALGRATRALREVKDFAVRNADIHVGVNVAEILETHQTHIISDNEAAVMTPVVAMQRYFTFAHQQLSFAGGHNVVTAEALYCLGKLHTVMAKHDPETLDIAKAIVFHRAAVSSDPQNSRSYNELGVLLARSGQLGEAEELFKTSLQITPMAETWQNLAKIHGRQGQVELAQLAQTEFAIASQIVPFQSPTAQIAWLPGQAFNQVGPADFHDSKSNNPGAVVPASRTTVLTDDANEKGSFKKAVAERLNLKNWF